MTSDSLPPVLPPLAGMSSFFRFMHSDTHVTRGLTWPLLDGGLLL